MKLFHKYYLMIAVPLLCCLVFIGFALSLQMYNYSVSEKHQTLSHTAQRVSVLTKDLYYNHTYSREELVKTIISTMIIDKKTHVVICDKNGQIFLTSDMYGTGYMGASINDRILAKTANSKEYSSVGTLDGLYNGENYTVGIAARNDFGEPIAYVYATTSISNIRKLMRYVGNLFFFLALVVFIITAFASYFVAKKMTKPMKQISNASSKFAHGDFSVRVPVYSTDEIGELTVAFNNMADSLEKSEDLRREFIANVSHELRSPMTSISGFVDGILDGTIPKEKEKQYLQIVSDEVQRLSRLVSNMLDITVLQSTNITTQSTKFDFCELVRRVLIGLEQRIDEKSISFDIKLHSESSYIFANEDSIFQLVYNLIDNALKFSPQYSVINIEVNAKNDKISFSIKNTGSNIPEEQLKSVFDRFHKTDKSRSKDKNGLGLGLYIAKTIVNQHNGKIWAKSKDNETEFAFEIPIVKHI